MRCLRLMLLVFAVVVAPLAIGGCGDGSSPAPDQSSAQKTHWRGEDTGYQSDEAAEATTLTSRTTGRQ
jgi:hypothetical protein